VVRVGSTAADDIAWITLSLSLPEALLVTAHQICHPIIYIISSAPLALLRVLSLRALGTGVSLTDHSDYTRV